MGKHKLSVADLQSRVKEKLDDNTYKTFIQSKHTQLEWACLAYDNGLLQEYEAESLLPMDYTVVKSHLWTHLTDDKIRSCIDETVLTVSTMYSVGTRFLGGWVLENEKRFTEADFYEMSLGNETFLKHSFRGVLDKGTINELITSSTSFNTIRSMYPTIQQLQNILPDLSAWNNMVGSIVSLYKESIRLHILTHLWTRILGHLKRFSIKVLGAKVVTRNRKPVLTYNDGKELPLGSLYEGITNASERSSLSQEIQNEIIHILSFFTAEEQTKLPFIPKTVSGNMFRLHLYIRAQVPYESMKPSTVYTEEVIGHIDASKTEIVPDDVDVQEYPGKGWTPVPISRMGRVHITIDQSKVLPAIIKKFNLSKKLTLQELFGLDRSSLKRKRAIIRKRIKNMSDAKKKKRARKSARCGGMGLMHRLSQKDCKPRSVMTDGVSLCVRYGSLRKGNAKITTNEKLSAFVKRTNARLIANDPGRVNIFQMTERDGEGFHHGRFTRAKYRIVGLSSRFQEERASKKKTAPGVIEAEDHLSSTGGWKARTKDLYMKSLTIFNTYGKRLIDHYSQKIYTQQKMMSYRRSQSVLIQRFSNFLDVDKKGSRTRHDFKRGIVLGIGNASFAPSGKGETAVPTTRVGRLFTRYLKCRGISFRFVSLDEFRTTKCCHLCENVLDDIRSKETHHVIRGLKSCCHCGTEKTGPLLLNRDANASINLLKVLEAEVANKPRPTYLRRPEKKVIVSEASPSECDNTPLEAKNKQVRSRK